MKSEELDKAYKDVMIIRQQLEVIGYAFDSDPIRRWVKKLFDVETILIHILEKEKE